MKSERKEKISILFLLIAVVIMTVGFASYAGFLNIDGTVTVKSSKWSIGYDAASYVESEKSVAATSKTITSDTYTFAVELSKPGDFYEATVNVENAGTFDAKVSKLEMAATIDGQPITAANEKYFKYTVKYDGQTYTSTADALASDLDASSSKPLVVRVDYIQPEDSADLPQTDVTVKVSGKLTYAIDQ